MELITECNVQMQGVSLNLNSNNLEFLQYVSNNFPISNQNPKGPDIEVRLSWREGLFKNPEPVRFEHLKHMDRAGRRIWLGQNELIITEVAGIKGLIVRVLYSNTMRIEAYITLSTSKYFVKRIYNRILRWKSFIQYKQDIYESLIYYLIYFPMLSIFEANGIYPMHASCVVFRGKTFLIPGLPGVGKSTLSLSLASYKSSKFLSDNIVLYDSSKVYSFFEPIKLDAKSINLLPDQGSCLEDLEMGSYYGRKLYKVKASRIQDEATPDILLIPFRTNKTSLLKIEQEQAIQLISDFNMIAGEVNSYLVFSSIQNLLRKNVYITERRINNLNQLIQKSQNYILYFEENAPISEIIKIIETEVLQNSHK